MVLSKDTTLRFYAWSGSTRIEIPGAVVDLQIRGLADYSDRQYPAALFEVSDPSYDSVRVPGLAVIIGATNRIEFSSDANGIDHPLSPLPGGYPKGYETKPYIRGWFYTPALPRQPLWDRRPPPGTRVRLVMPVEFIANGKTVCVTNVSSDSILTRTELKRRLWEDLFWGLLNKLGWRG